MNQSFLLGIQLWGTQRSGLNTFVSIRSGRKGKQINEYNTTQYADLEGRRLSFVKSANLLTSQTVVVTTFAFCSQHKHPLRASCLQRHTMAAYLCLSFLCRIFQEESRSCRWTWVRSLPGERGRFRHCECGRSLVTEKQRTRRYRSQWRQACVSWTIDL